MLIKQLSVFLENKKGRLLEIARLMGKYNIDIRALSMADTTDFGILRLILNDPDRAVTALKEEGFAVSLTEVIAIAVEDRPGGLANATQALYDNDIEIEYMYAFNARKEEKGFVVMKTSAPENSLEVFKKADIATLSEKEVYDILG